MLEEKRPLLIDLEVLQRSFTRSSSFFRHVVSRESPIFLRFRHSSSNNLFSWLRELVRVCRWRRFRVKLSRDEETRQRWRAGQRPFSSKTVTIFTRVGICVNREQVNGGNTGDFFQQCVKLEPGRGKTNYSREFNSGKSKSFDDRRHHSFTMTRTTIYRAGNVLTS